MLRVAITGGIGSGKSTVCKIFESMHIATLNADELATTLMQTNSAVRNAIISQFGEACYVNNILQKKVLAQLVFAEKNKLQLLNSLVHPVVKASTQKWYSQQSGAYAVYESALIIDINAQKDFDVIIGVQASLPLRVQRIITRSALSEQEVLSRINKQLPEAEKEKYYNYTIQNNEEQALIPQVLQLHNQLINEAHARP